MQGCIGAQHDLDQLPLACRVVQAARPVAPPLLQCGAHAAPCGRQDQRQQWLARKLCLLQRVCGMLAGVCLSCNGGQAEFGEQSDSDDDAEDEGPSAEWQQADWAAATAAALTCLQHLQPSTLRAATLHWNATLPPSITRALLPFSQSLESLSLECREIPAAAAPALAQLVQLRHLSFEACGLFGDAAFVPSAAVAALLQLTQLTSVQLRHPLGAEAAGCLAAALPSIGLLHTLHLSLCCLEDATLVHLVSCIAACSG